MLPVEGDDEPEPKFEEPESDLDAVVGGQVPVLVVAVMVVVAVAERCLLPLLDLVFLLISEAFWAAAPGLDGEDVISKPCSSPAAASASACVAMDRRVSWTVRRDDANSGWEEELKSTSKRSAATRVESRRGQNSFYDVGVGWKGTINSRLHPGRSGQTRKAHLEST